VKKTLFEVILVVRLQIGALLPKSVQGSKTAFSEQHELANQQLSELSSPLNVRFSGTATGRLWPIVRVKPCLLCLSAIEATG
jgi:hypothetical protein